jgi:hypothetical protein
MKTYLLPFAGAFLLFCGAFLALDAGIMSLQGLNLIFQP